MKNWIKTTKWCKNCHQIQPILFSGKIPQTSNPRKLFWNCADLAVAQMLCNNMKTSNLPVPANSSQNWFQCRIWGIRQSIAFKYSSTDVITLSLRTNKLSSTNGHNVKPKWKQNKWSHKSMKYNNHNTRKYSQKAQ